MVSEEIIGDNPWWDDPLAIDRDPDIKRWKESNVRWRPGVLDEFDIAHDAVYSLRGARRTGKTTAVKILVRELLGSGVNPWNVMYHACDIDDQLAGLYGVLRDYLGAGGRNAAERSFIFLDEISSVQNWQKAIKRLWDQGRLEGCTVIATGSHSVDIRMAAERLPGRRGGINDAMDKVMYPIKFSDYVSITGRGGGAGGGDALREIRDGRLPILEDVLGGRMPPQLAGVGDGQIGLLNGRLDGYMGTGGLPAVVENGWGRATIDENVYAEHMDTFLAELRRVEKSENAARSLIRGIAGTAGWPVSWTSLMKKSSLGDTGTVIRYVEALEDLFVVTVLYQYNVKSKDMEYRKDKKIHFVDPFYLYLFRGWTEKTRGHYEAAKMLGDDAERGRIVEGIVANHLARMAFARSPKKPWFSLSNYLYYWRYGPDKEVDFVYNDGHGVELPIEVKFKNDVKRRDLGGLITFKKEAGTRAGLVLTKSDLSAERECLKIPASLFLMLI